MSPMKTLRIFILSLVVLAFGACTQNNGHIGRLFGSWVLQSATLNGEVYPMPAGSQTYWSFQSDLLRVTLEEEYNYYQNFYGSFTQVGENMLRLNFTYSDNANASGTGVYGAPTWMGFPQSGTFDLTVANSDSDRLVLTYTKSPTETFIYTFAKTW